MYLNVRDGLLKKTLRLCLGIVMLDEHFYTRNLEEMVEKFISKYPIYQVQTTQTLAQYQQPTNNAQAALAFIDVNKTIYSNPN